MKPCDGNPTKHECHISPEGCEYCERYRWKSTIVETGELTEEMVEKAIKRAFDDYGKVSG